MYTLKNKRGSYLRGVNGDRGFSFTADRPQEAHKFATLGDLVSAIESRAKSTVYFETLKIQLGSIVKLTETPGTGETRRELGETEQAKAGETVKYAIGGWAKCGQKESGAHLTFFAPLAAATLYDTAAQATKALVDNAVAKGANVYQDGVVVRVAVKANEPVITETVLA